MPSLTNKRVLLGVTGGIAAYKAADVARRLREAGAEVRVVMTRNAAEFITPLTLQAVSGHSVRSALMDTEAEAGMGHIELARWADVVVVAPASADFLARLVQGRADDLLAALCLATEAPVAVAPAMNRRMWQSGATRDNVRRLAELGIHLFGPATGDQACGETGPGRMLEAPDIIQQTAALFETGALEGLTVMVTAGPTWEPIDPVRGITNRSSGKLGYAVAEAAAAAGARTILVAGPTALADPERVETVHVATARQMYDAVHARLKGVGIFIAVAAVADYRPAEATAAKIKKHAERLSLELVRNPDILASVAALEHGPFTVGFAAETEDLEQHAREKLRAKGVDLIAANPVGDRDAGFEVDTNTLLLVDRHGSRRLPLQSKTRLARALITDIADRYHARYPAQDSRPAHR